MDGDTKSKHSHTLLVRLLHSVYFSGMNKVLQLEELAQFLASVYAFSMLDFAWWWYPAFILTPDIGMIGYLVNSRIGAVTYNLFHHKGVAVLFLVFGFYSMNQALLLTGIILFGHASMDRIFGYGLKYTDSFKHTHLGQIGN